MFPRKCGPPHGADRGRGPVRSGFSTEYAVVRAGRRVRAAALWVAAWFAALAHDLMVTAFPGAAQVLKDLFGPIVLFVRGCGALLVHAHRIHQEKGFGAACRPVYISSQTASGAM